MLNKNNTIEEFKASLSSVARPNQFSVKFLAKPLWKYIKVRTSRAKNEIRTLADIWKDLTRFAEDVDKATKTVEEQLKTATTNQKVVRVFFAEESKYIEITNEDDGSFSIKSLPIKTNKEWLEAMAQHKEGNS